MGLSLLRTKLQAFAISSFYCGVGGALFAFAYLQTVEPSAFNIDLSFRILFMVIIGGLGTIMGSFLGAGFILLMPIFLNVFFHSRVRQGRRRHHHLGARAGHLRRDDHHVPDLRAARPGAAVATDQGKVAAVAVPALRKSVGAHQQRSINAEQQGGDTQHDDDKMLRRALPGIAAAARLRRDRGCTVDRHGRRPRNSISGYRAAASGRTPPWAPATTAASSTT